MSHIFNQIPDYRKYRYSDRIRMMDLRQRILNGTLYDTTLNHLYHDETDNKKLLKEFVELPFRLYRGNPNWVPPLRMAVNELLVELKQLPRPSWTSSRLS